MSVTPNLSLSKPVDGDTSWGDDYREAMDTLDSLFHSATGHDHDGTAGGGPNVPAANVSGLSTAVDARIAAADLADLGDVGGGAASDGQVLTWVGAATAWQPATLDLGDLGDVDLDPAPSDGDVLTYVAGSSAWEPVAPSGGGGATALDDLTDVNAPTPSNGDVLTWDSTPGEWVAAAPGVGALDLDDLGDVDTATTPPSDGDVLTYDNGSSLWVPAAPTGGSGPAIDSGAYASLPAGSEDDLYLPTDAPLILRKGASAWAAFGPIQLLKPPAIGDFTRVGGGSPSGSQYTGSRGGIYMTGGAWMAEIVEPATPYTATCAFLLHKVLQANARAGIYVRDTTSDDGVALWFTLLSGNPRIDIYTYSGMSAQSGASIYEEEAQTAGDNSPRLCWLRLADNGTTRTFYASLNGEVWRTINTQTRTSPATPNRLGLGLGNIGGEAAHFLHWEIA